MSQVSVDTTVFYQPSKVLPQMVDKSEVDPGKIYIDCVYLDIHFFPYTFLLMTFQLLKIPCNEVVTSIFPHVSPVNIFFFAFAFYTHSVCIWWGQHNERRFLFKPKELCIKDSH